MNSNKSKNRCKTSKLSNAALKRASKAAEKEERERIVLNQCIAAMWETFDFMTKKKFTKKDKERVLELNKLVQKYNEEK